MHIPSSESTTIQIIGRALRNHPLKTYAHIILPFGNNEDSNNVKIFLNIIAQNDSAIKNAFNNKIVGNYISIEKYNEDDEEKNCIDTEFKYNMIYDSMGKLNDDSDNTNDDFNFDLTNIFSEKEFNGYKIKIRKKDGYIYATDMCKAGNKLFGHYKENKISKNFLKELSLKLKIPTEDLMEINKGGKLQGSWVHPCVAINLAQWISPKFFIEVITWIC